MKRFWQTLGWILFGVFLQFKFDMLYGIVVLENLSFHDRGYFVKMQLLPAAGNVRILRVETTAAYTLGPDYFANIYIPEKFKVLNQTPYHGAEPIQGYKAFQMDMRRKYRDVLGKRDFVLAADDNDIPALPVIVHFENLRQLLHADKTYTLSSGATSMRLDGPEMIEAKYSQQWGM